MCEQATNCRRLLPGFAALATAVKTNMCLTLSPNFGKTAGTQDRLHKTQFLLNFLPHKSCRPGSTCATSFRRCTRLLQLMACTLLLGGSGLAHGLRARTFRAATCWTGLHCADIAAEQYRGLPGSDSFISLLALLPQANLFLGTIFLEKVQLHDVFRIDCLPSVAGLVHCLRTCYYCSSDKEATEKQQQSQQKALPWKSVSFLNQLLHLPSVHPGFSTSQVLNWTSCSERVQPNGWPRASQKHL